VASVATRVMELVQEPVYHGCRHHAGNDEHDQTAIQGIAAGKQLARWRAGRIDRPHATEQHRRVEEGIEQAEPFKPVIANHPDAERDGDQTQAERAVARQALEKLAHR
jgi:hypothetical protein